MSVYIRFSLAVLFHRSVTGGSFRPRIKSAAFSPIITEGAFVFPVGTSGIILASATLSPSIPSTLLIETRRLLFDTK